MILRCRRDSTLTRYGTGGEVVRGQVRPHIPGLRLSQAGHGGGIPGGGERHCSARGQGECPLHLANSNLGVLMLLAVGTVVVVEACWVVICVVWARVDRVDRCVRVDGCAAVVLRPELEDVCTDWC